MSDRFTTDVLREAFFAVTDEMFESLKRTSQSPVIYEVLDFAVGLTDAGGELVSQGNGIAGFLGPLGEAVRDTLVRIPDLAPGDVVATNDPFAGGGGHLSDVAMVRPIFVDGELVAFAGGEGPLDGGRWEGSRVRGPPTRSRSSRRGCSFRSSAWFEAASSTATWWPSSARTAACPT